MFSSIDKRASLISTPVISLVIEAIGRTAFSFLLNKTSLVSWSTTNATLDLRSRASCLPCNPANCPYEGLGVAAITLAGRAALTTCFFWRLDLALATVLVGVALTDAFLDLVAASAPEGSNSEQTNTPATLS